ISTNSFTSVPSFLQTQVVALRTSRSRTSFKIHRGLLVTKCPFLDAAIAESRTVANMKPYICTETRDSTLVAFIQWAYTGEEEDESMNQESDDESTIRQTTDELTEHVELYIFCHWYRIPELQEEAFRRIKLTLAMLRPSAGNMSAVVSAIRLVEARLPRVGDDPLRDHFAHYVAWEIDSLREFDCFRMLLRGLPDFALLVFAWVRPSELSPVRGGVAHG
ncbi:hypothetical protein BO71DRAFT_338571, partial [Aspergillus ellipticus CBS 707.79]